MVKKEFIVMKRYPISFITSFGMVFIIMLIFIFAISMFMPPDTHEWDDAAQFSDDPLVLAQQHNGTVYIGFQAHGPAESAALLVWNCSISPGNSNASDYVSTYSNGIWTVEIAEAPPFITYYDGSEYTTWNISAPLPEGNVTLDGKMNTGGSSMAGIAFYGYIFFIFLQDIVWVVGDSLRDEQFQGTLESLYLTPVNKFSNLIARAFMNVAWTGANVVVGLIVVSYITGGLPSENVGFAMAVLFLALLQMFGMGFIFAAFTLRAKGSADFIMNFVAIIFTFTCAMFFPFAVLPDAMVNYVSRLIPLSYAVDLFRSALMGFPYGFPELASAGTELWISIAFAVITPLLGYVLYRKIERSAREKGTLSEY